METINNVEKEIEVKIEQGREQLVVLKDVAYEKYCEAWKSMEQVQQATYDTLTSAWEQAWTSYAAIVEQLKQYGHTAIETGSAEYEVAKTNLAERTKDLQNWIAENGSKLKEESSDIQIEAARKLHVARKEAYDKYLQSKDALRNLFSTSQQEAQEGVRNAEDQVKKATQSLERHLEGAADKSSEEYNKTKLRLEEAKLKAEKELEAAKTHINELSGKVSNWTQEVGNTLSEQSEFLSLRMQQMKEQLYDAASNSKEKVEETTEAATKVVSERWDQIYNLLKEDSEYAVQKLSQFKETIQEKIEDVLVATGITEPTIPASPEPTAAKEPVVEQPVPPISPINVPLAM